MRNNFIKYTKNLLLNISNKNSQALKLLSNKKFKIVLVACD